jgi:predicted lipid-binding transport protein (Tim44 family)
MNNNKAQLYILLTVILTVLILISPLGIELIQARPGGGHSFSGGGGSSGGGGGGGDGIEFLIYFIFSELPPEISIPLVIAIIVIRIIVKNRNKKEKETISASVGIDASVSRTHALSNNLISLKSIDPNFSKVLFLDFVSSLYQKYYSWFGTDEFKNLSPFFEKSDLEKSAQYKNMQSVNEIVIGSMRIGEINILSHVTGISVDIEANYTVNIKDKKTRYSVTERWYLNRKSGIVSSEPEKLRKIVCPVCAAPANFTDTGVCNSCGNEIHTGEFQWFVKKHNIIRQEVFSVKGLGYYAPETGTQLPTVYQYGLNTAIADFSNQHKINWNQWETQFKYNIASKYFMAIYSAWSSNNLHLVRSLLTDRIYESFMFWMQAFKQAGLVNKLENININAVETVKIETDKFYESITLRIFASSLDYVSDASGNVKGGSNKRMRSYTEYWTFIRRNGVEKDSHDIASCPNCGAPADKMGQAGICEYCGTKISNGDFSWVLAIITQDEVYSG